MGLGWRVGSCLKCDKCLSEYHNHCLNEEDVIIARHGGFANKVRCYSVLAFELPDGINIKTAGPLLCNGITVFNSLFNNIKGAYQDIVVGIGRLGYMTIKFLNA
jgi:alcohol/geraniol dehydrogenase (NADP+)